MNRLPTRKTLEAMSSSNRWSMLAAIAKDLRDEVNGLQSEAIMIWDGTSRARVTRNSRRKLARVYEVAQHFGDYVGEPLL